MRALCIRSHRARFVYASILLAQARNAFARGMDPPVEMQQDAMVLQLALPATSKHEQQHVAGSWAM